MVTSHLKDDIGTFYKEAAEDKELIKKLMKPMKKSKKQNMEDKYREHSGEERAEHGYKKPKNSRKSFDRFVKKEEAKKKKRK